MACGPSMGASSRASIMPTESRLVPFEKRLITVSSAAAAEYGRVAVVMPNSTIAANFIGRHAARYAPGRQTTAAKSDFKKGASLPATREVPMFRHKKLGIKVPAAFKV